MKKLIKLLIIAIVTQTNILFANRNDISSANFKENDSLKKESSAKTRNINPASGLKWQWDTIIEFNTKNKPYKRFIQSFDEKGNVIERLTEKYNNNKWAADSRINYTYDNNNNLLYETKEEKYKDWELKTRSTYTYNEKENKKNCLKEEWRNNSWEKMSITEFTYDKNGWLLSEFKKVYTNEEWENQYIDEYINDSKGNIKTKISKYWLKNRWDITSRETYKNDSIKHQTIMYDEGYSENLWHTNFIETFNYDQNDNIVSIKYQWWWQNCLIEENNKIYTYDAYGNSLTGNIEIIKGFLDAPGAGVVYIYSNKTKGIELSNSYNAHWRSFQ